VFLPRFVNHPFGRLVKTFVSFEERGAGYGRRLVLSGDTGLFHQEIGKTLIDLLFRFNIIGPPKRRDRLGQGSDLDDILLQVSGKDLGKFYRSLMLGPAKKDIEAESKKGTPADPCSPPSPEDADQPRQKEDPGKDQIDDKDQIPGIPVIKERGKNHRSIGGKKIEEDVADKNRKADLVIAPEVRAFRDLYKNPAEEKSIKRNEEQRMGKIPVILEVKLPVKEAQNKVGVREKPHGQACDGPPVSDLLIVNGLCNDRSGQGMGKGIHGMMVT
jgi:hypothetical protein